MEEGLGHELETLQRAHRLLVHAIINPKTCSAIIKELELGPEVPGVNVMQDSFF